MEDIKNEGLSSEFQWKPRSNLIDKYHDYEYPKVSIIIPTLNCSQLISLTLESLLTQDYPDFEILIIDAGSYDRTLEVINSYHSHRIQLFSISQYQRYEMLNKGISHASGMYLNFLFPGDFYISKDALRSVMSLALDNDRPELIYCGTLLRDGKSEVKILYRPLTLDLLKNGQQPTSLQSCWFSIDAFSVLGKFNAKLRQRGGYDLMCRFVLDGKLRHVSLNRVLIDYDLRWVTRTNVFCHFWETRRIITKYFGYWATYKWFWQQKDVGRFMRLWFRSLKIAFFGRSS